MPASESAGDYGAQYEVLFARIRDGDFEESSQHATLSTRN